jgi:hypothetical protein
VEFELEDVRYGADHSIKSRMLNNHNLLANFLKYRGLRDKSPRTDIAYEGSVCSVNRHTSIQVGQVLVRF